MGTGGEGLRTHPLALEFNEGSYEYWALKISARKQHIGR